MTDETTNEDQTTMQLRQIRSAEVVTAVVTAIIDNGIGGERSGVDIATDLMSAYTALLIVAKAIDLGQDDMKKIAEYVGNNAEEYASISAEMLRKHLSGPGTTD